ncbi:MAG: hypothetical protein COW00_03410 [Bdellovibrio sp. CG12_big_fil_rev_8_21_14_0_65_39_13]|nr:MAG: hypothetical protein COW78_10815 [Bdellovibrio sp. CG22_combo_CG10-13_8_21_14_all_39_27]PIQ61625.1 MAG: hypothetical protein COW00_03410 [Bdellovibrio sp. CG12_big_fil_rev_8_21_14_0_65_39_13]PIR35688.1 MAG: hypothetical protein COV37_07205 [Bdellovibrio sp. CG11_big_fil_rev_8_21_14_0_20_39_38]
MTNSDIIFHTPGLRALKSSGPFSVALKQGKLSRRSLAQGRVMQLCEQLKEMIEGHFVKYPHVSINGFAMKSGVGATTLRRILSDSIKGDPAPHTVLNIASALTNEKRLSVLIDQYQGPVGMMLKSTFGPYVEQMVEHKNMGDLEGELLDPIKYFIYKLAANRTGVSEQSLFNLFGKLGLEKAEELYNKKFLDLRVNGYHAKEKKCSLDYKIVAGHLPEMVKFYKPENVSLGKNLFYTMSESVNEQAIAEIKKIQKEAIQKIFDILESDDYRGEIPYFTLNLCDTLDYGRTSEVLQ